MLRFFILAISLASSTLAFADCSVPSDVRQKLANNAKLLEGLMDSSRTDLGAQQIRELGHKDSSFASTLAPALSNLIDTCHDGAIWRNSISLAGDLKLGQDVPALIRALDRGEVGLGIITAVSESQLDNDMVGRALADVGDPAVASLSKLLRQNDVRMRRRGANILLKIGSPTAKEAVSDYVSDEKDAHLKAYILARLSE